MTKKTRREQQPVINAFHGKEGVSGPHLLCIGRKAPKGYTELPGGIHLGRGLWLLPVRRNSYYRQRNNE